MECEKSCVGLGAMVHFAVMEKIGTGASGYGGGGASIASRFLCHSLHTRILSLAHTQS